MRPPAAIIIAIILTACRHPQLTTELMVGTSEVETTTTEIVGELTDIDIDLYVIHPTPADTAHIVGRIAKAVNRNATQQQLTTSHDTTTATTTKQPQRRNLAAKKTDYRQEIKEMMCFIFVIALFYVILRRWKSRNTTI